jgi:hypothetical protein
VDWLGSFSVICSVAIGIDMYTLVGEYASQLVLQLNTASLLRIIFHRDALVLQLKVPDSKLYLGSSRLGSAGTWMCRILVLLYTLLYT